MTQIPENRARSSEWMQIGARLRSLPTLLHNGNRTIEGFHIVDNDQIPPQTKRIIEIAGHDISDVSKITYLNIGPRKGINLDLSISWDINWRTFKYREPNIHGLRLVFHAKSSHPELYALVGPPGNLIISEKGWALGIHPEELNKVRKFIRAVQNLGVEDRYDLLTEIADGIEASIGTVEDSSELSY